MKLHALLNVYNDRTFLSACLESLTDFVNTIIVADGAYELYYKEFKRFDPEAKPWSTDGTIEIIKSFRGGPEIKWITKPEPKPSSDLIFGCWPSQTIKRTALIDAVPIGDWFVITDADEMIAGDPEEAFEMVLESGCLQASTPLYNPGTHVERVVKNWHPRFFRKTEGMHYRGTHWHLRDKFGRVIETRYPRFWTDVMAIIHFKSFKSQSRLIPHQNYMAELAERGWLEPTQLGKVLMKSDQ